MNMPPKYDVIVCGSLHLDIVVKAKALPQLDETAVGSAWQQVCGGKGGNQAVQAAYAGAKTAMISRVGLDGFGETLLKNLHSAGVDKTMVQTDPHKGSGMSVAIVQDDGDYGAVFVSGANLEIDANLVAKSWHDLGSGKVLVLQNEVPEVVNLAAAMAARSSGAIVVFNAAPARKLSADLSELVDVLIVNRVEAEMISGFAVIDRASAMQSLQPLGAEQRAVIITLGGNGLVLQEKAGRVVEIEALPVKVTSTHGAGDCFAGVLAASLAKEMPLEAACRLANERAAAHVSRT
jgi:ribokinase